MMDSQAKLIHSRIWDLISDYADIRNELEGALDSIRILYGDLELAMEDIAEELDAIEDHLGKTSHTLKRFRAADNPPPPRADEEEELPWN
ncbi:MAG: hypothetical protein IKF16_05085 [Lachnospiraceae bacterium]|nr:hypothetical protein [Lachnospiraceae bacterium]